MELTASTQVQSTARQGKQSLINNQNLSLSFYRSSLRRDKQHYIILKNRCKHLEHQKNRLKK